MADTNDPRLLRLRVELYTAAQLLKGEDLEYLKELVREIHQVLDLDDVANEERDVTWQNRLRQLHEGFDGDGCESGDPIDWSLAALGNAIAHQQNTFDELQAEFGALKAAHDQLVQSALAEGVRSADAIRERDAAVTARPPWIDEIIALSEEQNGHLARIADALCDANQTGWPSRG